MANPAEPISRQICWPSPGSFAGHQRAHQLAAGGQKLMAIDTRVSLADQNTDLQIRELEAAGCERIYKDQGISGTRVSRPELDRMLDRLGPGDEVVVWKLDRLGRNTRHLLELLDDFKVEASSSVP